MVTDPPTAFSVCIFAKFPSLGSAAGYQVRLEWDDDVLQLNPRTTGVNDLWHSVTKVNCGPPNGSVPSQNTGTGYIRLDAQDGFDQNANCAFDGQVDEFEFSCRDDPATTYRSTNLELVLLDGQNLVSYLTDGSDAVKTALNFLEIRCLDPDVDSDLDGCTNADELGTDEGEGGLRDPMFYWDFYDVPTGTPFQRDRVVTVSDISAVAGRFGSSGDSGGDPLARPIPAVPDYHTAYDRTNMGTEDWETGAPDGTLSVVDLVKIQKQFGHNCSSP